MTRLKSLTQASSWNNEWDIFPVGSLHPSLLWHTAPLYFSLATHVAAFSKCSAREKGAQYVSCVEDLRKALTEDGSFWQPVFHSWRWWGGGGGGEGGNWGTHWFLGRERCKLLAFPEEPCVLDAEPESMIGNFLSPDFEAYNKKEGRIKFGLKLSCEQFHVLAYPERYSPSIILAVCVSPRRKGAICTTDIIYIYIIYIYIYIYVCVCVCVCVCVYSQADHIHIYIYIYLQSVVLKKERLKEKVQDWEKGRRGVVGRCAGVIKRNRTRKW